MSETWEHVRLTVDDDGKSELHLYTSFPDTVEWARQSEEESGVLADVIDRLGRAGWQLVSVNDMQVAYDFFFKRRRA